MNNTVISNLIHHYASGHKKYQLILIAMTAFIFAAVCYSHEFFWTLVKTDLVVNPTILFIIVASTAYCYSSLHSIERETELLFSLQEDFQHGISCNEMKFGILFLIARTFNTILSERGMLYITSSAELNAIVKSYTDNIEARIFYIGFASAMCVSLGLFGTFMGLTQTIASMSTLLSNLYEGLAGEGADILGTMVQLIGELQAPLGGMALAFATSLLGLIGSMILGLHIVLLNRAAAYAQGNLENWLASLLVPEKEEELSEKAGPTATIDTSAIEKVALTSANQLQLLVTTVEKLAWRTKDLQDQQAKLLEAFETIIQQNKKD